MTKTTRYLLLFTVLPFLILIGAYFATRALFEFYIDSGAGKLLTLEEQGALSREYGYVWQEINTNNEMSRISGFIDTVTVSDSSDVKKKVKRHDFPSLAAVEKLNELKNLRKTIRINDRNGIPLAQIQTTHTCVELAELNDTLIQSLLLTEDRDFHTRKKAYDYNALFRATLNAAFRSLRTLKLHYPRGSSTIHMQVARFLLLQYDSRGYAYVEKTVARKLKEMKLAQALKMTYSDDSILRLYVNHCVSAGNGMHGYHDISKGLFGVEPDSLDAARSLYLARLVKWNRQVPEKIISQVKLSLPALAAHFGWNKEKQKSIIGKLDTLTFNRPPAVIPKRGYILDLANEYWRRICAARGMNDSLQSTMDIADPESIIRRYGNLTIDLTIDYRLQRLLEKIVQKRGFGSDTTIRTDIRIGSFGTDIQSKTLPPDTIRLITVYDKENAPGALPASARRVLTKGDTLISNVRYKRKDANTVRRSCFFYKRDSLRVQGQYHAYAMMDSRTQELLAYYSKDQLGSRLRSLHVNLNPNGSSVTKPLIYALAYDLGIYEPTQMESDDKEVGDSCEWARSYLYQNDTPAGMIYHNVPEDSGYSVQNHNRTFDGYDFLFNHLSHSNNIIAVQTMYRLATDLSSGKNAGQSIKDLLNRFGKKEYAKLKTITGPQIYSALVDAMRDTADAIRKHSRNYSVALGTLELSLYEQMHLFNILYNNKVAVSPQKHPSLFIKRIRFGGKPFEFVDKDIEHIQVFSDSERLKPVHLALHKRLISNPADGLSKYDHCGDQGVLSNYAKSGTTDDIIRPFDADITDDRRTNYGLWNAVLRLRLKRDDLRKAVLADSLAKTYKNLHIRYDSVDAARDLDVTLACFGECNEHYTGARDGKTLHGYVSRELLHAFGIACGEGFYAGYEQKLIEETSDKDKYAGTDEESDLSFLSRALIKIRTGVGSEAEPGEIKFEEARWGTGIRLKGENYRMMLKFAQYMGDNARYYRDLIKQLRKPGNIQEAESIITQIDSIKVNNRILMRDLEKACTSLRESLKDFGSKEE